jgi:hypothetical protein
MNPARAGWTGYNPGIPRLERRMACKENSSGFCRLFWTAANLVFLLVCRSAVAGPDDGWAGLRLSYDKPASEWVEALPIGNGRLGVRHPPAVSDRRELRRDLGDHRDAAAKPRRRNQSTAGSAEGLGPGGRYRPQGTRRVRGGLAVGGVEVGIGASPRHRGRELQAANCAAHRGEGRRQGRADPECEPGSD